ncbi:hypothetical protein OJJOAM_000857 [Cupriavidus sp. H18C1]
MPCRARLSATARGQAVCTIPVPASQKSLASPAGASAGARQRTGLAVAAIGAVLFSGKAIVAKLMYRYNVDAVMVITLRMLFAVPLFMAIGWWQSMRLPPLSWADRGRVLMLGFIGYYLSSFLDFLGLQYITAGLERLILFLTPSFVVLATAFGFKRHISRQQWISLLLAYAGIVLVLAHDLDVSGSQVWLGAALVLGSALSYAVYLIASGELVARIGSLRLVAYAMCVSTACCVVQYLVLGRPLGRTAAAGAGDVAVGDQRGVLHRVAGVADDDGGGAHRRADGLAGRHDRPGVDAVPRLLAAGRADHRGAAGRQRAGDGRHLSAVARQGRAQLNRRDGGRLSCMGARARTSLDN